MAYNDYGAFVYLNGERQPDYEDVPIFGDKDTDLGPGERIYASLLRQYGNMAESDMTPFEWPSRCQHGTMGNGKVRVGVYKVGISAASIYVLADDAAPADDTVFYKGNGGDGEQATNGKGPFDVAIESSQEIVTLSGQEFVPFPKGYDGSDEHKAQADENSRQIYGPYRYEFDLAGHHLLFEARECSAVVRPSYHARMTCPDGDIWDVFYDSNYGAGLSDYVFRGAGCGRDPKYNRIDVKRVGDGDTRAWPLRVNLPVSCRSETSRSGIVSEQVISVTESTLDELAETLGIVADDTATGVGGDPDGRRILYRAMEDESGERYPVSTFWNWRDGIYIDAEVAIKLVNLGIDLARMGVDAVEQENWWPRRQKESLSYGLDDTPFAGFSYGLRASQMLPREVRNGKDHPMHDEDKTAGMLMDEVFKSYQDECEQADWSVVIDRNELDVELVWPIRDAKGVPFSPLMTQDGDGCRWQVARRINGGEACEVVGCGWNDESPFILLGDGEMANPSNFEIVKDDGEEQPDDEG